MAEENSIQRGSRGDAPYGRRETDRPFAPPWQRLMNRPGQFVLDIGVLTSAFVLSYLLRFEFNIPDILLNFMDILPYFS